jgi:hypothetical protein
MPLVITDSKTSASGRINEDRAGAAHDLAWVIDGATDVVERPLTSAATDADWIAGRLDAILTSLAVTPPTDLAQLPDLTAARLANEFAREARREPLDKTEHPSASAIVVKACEHGLDYVSVGDCTLLAESSSGFVRVGVDDAGDPQLAKALAALHAKHSGLDAKTAWARISPSVKAGRGAMKRALWHVFHHANALPFRAGGPDRDAGGRVCSAGKRRSHASRRGVSALHGF